MRRECNRNERVHHFYRIFRINSKIHFKMSANETVCRCRCNWMHSGTTTIYWHTPVFSLMPVTCHHHKFINSLKTRPDQTSQTQNTHRHTLTEKKTKTNFGPNTRPTKTPEWHTHKHTYRPRFNFLNLHKEHSIASTRLKKYRANCLAPLIVIYLTLNGIFPFTSLTPSPAMPKWRYSAVTDLFSSLNNWIGSVFGMSASVCELSI